MSSSTHGGVSSWRRRPRPTAAIIAVLLGAASMCPSLHYRGHATPGQAVPGLRTSMTGALTADDVEAVCSPCGDSCELATPNNLT